MALYAFKNGVSVLDETVMNSLLSLQGFVLVYEGTQRERSVACFGDNMVTAKETIRVTGEWLFYLDGQLVKREKNLIVQSGLNFLAALLIRENGQTNDVSFHLALGTGTAAPAATDTKLVAEGLRKTVSAKTRQANMVRLRTFFIAQEANGTWTEFGIFLAGTDAKDSGVLLNRITPTGGISKSSQQVLTVEVRLTFTAG